MTVFLPFCLFLLLSKTGVAHRGMYLFQGLADGTYSGRVVLGCCAPHPFYPRNVCLCSSRLSRTRAFSLSRDELDGPNKVIFSSSVLLDDPDFERHPRCAAWAGLHSCVAKFMLCVRQIPTFATNAPRNRLVDIEVLFELRPPPTR